MKMADVYEPIDYVLAFKILKPEYRGPYGSPIVRIAKQLSEIDGVRFLEL